jgi:hypothetical protein
MEMSCVVMDADKWEVDAERGTSKFDAGYYRKLIKKAREEVTSLTY